MRQLLSILMVVSAASNLLGQKFQVGNSLGVDIPKKEFAENLEWGLAFNLNMEYQWKSISATGEIGWVRWFSDELFDPETPPDAWALLAGLRWRSAKLLYVGAKTGYYFNYPGSLVLIPEIGATYNQFDLNIGYSALQNSEFLRIRITYFWGDQ